ncbi:MULTISPECIES: MFS transporter [unclassified Variovorax]|jgi:MFS family permease|uniref:MFS transporter n=1 Tax=unclassified Variovorax TaxID=663243 RepID=UPI0008CAD2DD|nr:MULTISPECIES: MFS transporter [unclassified Variovorax]SEK10237.1 Predicted arabinose efflux permease, MFS family [Variovorax sp. OK202]SFD66977.1 Predicted arabinose efflux permease, MFS family [Variovorax sp. OK212]
MSDTTLSTPHPAASDAEAARRRLRRQSLLFASLFSLLLFGLSLLLIAWRVEQVLVTLTQDRTDRMVRQLAEDGENAMRLGLTVGDLGFLEAQMARLAQREPSLRMARVASADGQVVARYGDAALKDAVAPRWDARLLADASAPVAPGKEAREAPVAERTTPTHVLGGTVLLDPAGVPAATVWAVFDPTALRRQARDAGLTVVLRALPLVLVSLAVIWAVLYLWGWQTVRMLQPSLSSAASSSTRERGVPRWALVLLLAGVLAAPLALVGIAREAARPFVTTQIEANADAVLAAMAARIERAVQYGVPLNALNGVDALFTEQLAAAPELSGLSLRDASGQKVAQAGGTGSGTAASDAGGVLERTRALAGTDARMVVSYPADYVDRTLGAMLVDLFLALVISAVLMRELTRGLWRRSLLHPLMEYRAARGWQRFAARVRRRRGHEAGSGAEGTAAAAAQRARALLGWTSASDVATGTAATVSPAAADWGVQMTRLRLAVFLVALSEELLRPFFTVLASEMAGPGSGWSPEMLAGIPVAAFMATFAAAQPMGPWIARRFDIRLSLMLAAIAGAGALAASAWVHEASLLVLLRAIGGAAYGLALILAQTAVVRFTPQAQRARGLTEVATAIVAAGIVGPPFGGMIAGRVGDSFGMVACALAMLLAFAALLRLRLPTVAVNPPAAGSAAARGGWRGYAAVLREPRAMTIILGSAVPARLVAVMVLSIVVPLYMHDIGQPPAVAGRVLLLYFLCYAMTASLMAHWSDAAGERRRFIVAGCVIAGAACLAVPLLGGLWGMAACCALLGAGQATQSPSQIAMVTEVFEKKPPQQRLATPEQAIAAYRLIERLGSVAAPFVTALAILWAGLAGALSVVGLAVALAGAAVWFGLRPVATRAAVPGAAA